MKFALAPLILIGAVGLAGSAEAQQQQIPQEQQILACLSSGQAYTPGQIVCIPGCHGAQRLARCDVVSGQTTWTTVSNNCPTANMSPIARFQVAMFTPVPRLPQ